MGLCNPGFSQCYMPTWLKGWTDPFVSGEVLYQGGDLRSGGYTYMQCSGTIWSCRLDIRGVPYSVDISSTWRLLSYILI